MSKTAFIYPGQGAQTVGMGRDFYEQSALARELYEQAGESLSLDLKALCFEPNERLDITEYTQACLVTTCLAMTRVVLERTAWRPDLSAGLSLGEYCAIAVAGGLSELDAVRLVRERGILMEHAVPDGRGAMSAVLGLDAAAVEAVTAALPDVTIANYNCPGQIVITGLQPAVAAAGEQLKAAGAKRVVPLKVSGPFHSPLLAAAGEQLGTVLKTVRFHELQRPYVTNVTAEPISRIAETPELLARQVAAPVRWQQSVERMIRDGVTTFVEIGPGRTLNSFIRKISRDVRVVNIAKWEDMDHGR